MVAAIQTAQASGSGLRSVSYNGRTITYASAQEMQASLDYWIRMVTQLERKQARLSRHGYAVADFRGNR